MATKTSTSTNISISQNGDVYTVKEVKTKTTTTPGKDPVVEKTETVNEYKGEANLPEEIRRQLEQQKKVEGPLNMNATRGNFAEDVLREINKCRKIHGADPLRLSSELVKHSEERAKRMAEKDDMHDEDDKYGGSITCMSSNDPEFYVKAEAVVTRWYSGSQGYDYTVEPEELTAGHFTQMIWKNTKEFGVAAAKSKTNQIYIVACFNPRGNYVKQFIENVCPPVSKGRPIFTRALFGVFDKKKSSEVKKCSNMDMFNKEGLDCHNKYRALHGVPPLKYSAELARYAQEWADDLARGEYQLQHRIEAKYGENLYYFYSSDPNVTATASDACDSWYSEIQYYTYSLSNFYGVSGHFTQLIWKSTTEVGMGRARSKRGKQYIVANYNPPGNFSGRYAQNVPKPLT
ncbi:UNVERIFIED_CONTAM: hypothetical protein PYX00_009112 [Menopon gallinae]|uniref:SCP domain-containing protein n=1 Tax=Menopon gallinae TaxID=328185 RepID=A0AAW2HAE9_9NEOP